MDKKRIFEIYEKAKKGEYDLEKLSEDELKALNSLIEEEIRIKKKKLKELEIMANN